MVLFPNSVLLPLIGTFLGLVYASYEARSLLLDSDSSIYQHTSITIGCMIIGYGLGTFLSVFL